MVGRDICFACGISCVLLCVTDLFNYVFAPISRHLNGSDMSNSSFWLRVALGSAVVAVLGFAIYRAVARLKWSNNQLSFSCFFFFHRHSIHPSIKTKPPRPDPEPPQSELDLVRIVLLPTLKAPSRVFKSLPFSVYDFFTLSSPPWPMIATLQMHWKLVITLFPALLCPAFSALHYPTRLCTS